ncbi:MAG: hypothetical protein PHW52_00310 [Candidatus Pacebacteria bacterium]|nr:hypothetical protein [Candidatus Paceibacterota bacterium]
MIYKDIIHGEVEISEPVILELIDSPSIQRLKGIDQAGYSEPYFPNTKHNRFEHSMGDYLLLKKYGAPIEEQINGLIHDVSHSAFSHCIDYVLASGSQKDHDLQDNIFVDFVLKTEIPSILRKYDFDVDYILDEKNFPLQERNLPDLCADRIDYSLRTAIVFKESEQEEVRNIMKDLVVKDNQWVFNSFDTARRYAEIFLQMNNKYYSGVTSGVMFLTVGDYLKHSLKRGYITENDLYLTDMELLNKIRKFHDQDADLQLFFDRMDRRIGFSEDPTGYYSKVSCKSRVVDPSFMKDGRIMKVSDIDGEWKDLFDKYSGPKDYYISFDE